MTSSTFAKFFIGDALGVLRTLPDRSVNAVITSPPYLGLREYLPHGHRNKDLELGREPSPADFLESLLRVTDELYRVLADDGTIWFVLGDSAAGSGGSGGDYLTGGMRSGQPKAPGSAKLKREYGGQWPLDKSVCWIPSLFGASLAYGRNLLNGLAHQQWITRPPITWCKPNPHSGEIIDKCRPATELIVFAAKQANYYFDLDSIREPTNSPQECRITAEATDGLGDRHTYTRQLDSKGKPPLDYWVVPTKPYKGAHFATFPPDLITRPTKAACPPGGVVLDPFCGTGTTLAVVHGHGRSAIGIDLDERNSLLARARVGLWLEVEDRRDKSNRVDDVSSQQQNSCIANGSPVPLQKTEVA